MRNSLLALTCLAIVPSCVAQSIYSRRPDDPKAVYLQPSDGSTDDSAALQEAIDRVQQTVHHGIVFVPEGHFRLDHTVHVWAGIRLIGYGATRPVFILAPNSADFQSGPDHYMLWYTDERTPASQPISDASEFTFYSALSNIDFEIGDGNPSAVAIRFNVAQHSFVDYADFEIGSAKAALEAIGNQAHDIHIHGGEYGIITGKTSAAWQFLLMDSTFDGQRKAAISTHEAGFTLIRDRISHVPVAIEIPEGQVEQLYGRDLQLEDISDSALRMGDAKNLRNEINLTNIACRHVKRFADGYPFGAGPSYIEEHFSMGLEIAPTGREAGIQMHHRETAGAFAPVTPDAPDIYKERPMKDWVNVRTLGAKGDGNTDDTSAIQRAIDQHATLYFPSGLYRLTGSLHLRADTVLIGLSPFTTQFTLVDGDSHFQAGGAAIPLLVSPQDGHTVVTGIGISTGNLNPRACGIEWRAGANSMVEDVEFTRGHNEAVRIFAPDMPKPPQGVQMQLDAQYPSLWVHDGGGGIFRDNWSHAGTAQAGLLVENTSTPGVIYQLSNEHHMQREIRFDHAANWQVYDMQTEEEKPEGADAVALEIVKSNDLLFANTYMYRVSRNIMPKLYAAMGSDADRVIFENVKVFSQTRLSFDNSIFDQNSGVDVRAHHFAYFALTKEVRKGAPLPIPPVFAKGAALRQAGTGFSNASGLTADPAGAIYFTDAALHMVYQDSAGNASVQLLAALPEMPQVVGYVAPSTLLVVNWERSVSNINTQTGQVTPVKPADAAEAGTTLLLPVGLHNEMVQLQWLLGHVGYQYRIGSNTATRSDLEQEPRFFYYAPDSKTAIETGPAPKRYAAWAWRPLPESCQLGTFNIGTQSYLTSEDDEKTYSGTLESLEKLNTKMVIERGGTSVVSDTAGNVYIASGQVYIYDRNMRQIGVLEIPERPSSLVFGGAGKHTLFIGARSSLYAIETSAGAASGQE